MGKKNGNNQYTIIPEILVKVYPKILNSFVKIYSLKNIDKNKDIIIKRKGICGRLI